ncbi:MAG: hypothetical protein LBH52_03835 [Puniceicoccales bacterium]|jgi:hypothetical protein|nr:hypothetical protein [Puniceicoccales bacterium]
MFIGKLYTHTFLILCVFQTCLLFTSTLTFSMPTIPPFRVFVNECGVSSHLSICNPEASLAPNIVTSKENVAQWYWLLSSLQIKYTYTINDFPIINQIVADFSQKTLKDRIEQNVVYNAHFENADTEVSTSCMISLGQVCDLEKVRPPFSITNKTTLNISNDADIGKQFGLYFNIEDSAYDHSFRFGSNVYTQPLNYSNYVLLDTYACPLMDSQLKFILQTPEPDEYEGKILEVQIIPEFFTIQSDA